MLKSVDLNFDGKARVIHVSPPPPTHTHTYTVLGLPVRRILEYLLDAANSLEAYGQLHVVPTIRTASVPEFERLLTENSSLQALVM